MSALTNEEIAALSFQRLRDECRKANLSTSGKTEQLRKRLRGWVLSQTQTGTQNNPIAEDDNNGDHEEETAPKRQKKSVVDDLVCPITLELPFDPVFAEDGRVYERSAIEAHIKSRNEADLKSPITNQKIGKKVIPATQHRNMIETLIENGDITGELAEKWKKKAEEKKDMEDLLRKAERGDGEAQTDVAKYYYRGQRGFSKDLKMAFQWYKKAHASGNVYATAKMGYMLCNGAGVCKCAKDGILYIAMAAGQGSDLAAYYLGMALADGDYGISSNSEEAMRWLEKALSGSCSIKNLNLSGKNKARAKLQELINERVG